jgi:hypothetical protein
LPDLLLFAALGFGLGVLACVAVDAIERRRKHRAVVVVYAGSFADSSPRARREAAHLIAQDSTLR